MLELTCYCRHFATILKKSGTRIPRVELEEIGPFIEFEVRRDRFGDAELRKVLFHSLVLQSLGVSSYYFR